MLLLPKEKKLLWLMFIPAILIPLSRVYLGLHYPSDILGGAVIGAGFGWIFAMIFRKLSKTSLRRGAPFRSE